MPLLTPEQHAKLLAKKAAAAAQAGSAPAAAPSGPTSPPAAATPPPGPAMPLGTRLAETFGVPGPSDWEQGVGQAPPATKPPPAALEFEQLNEGTLRMLESIVEQLGARGAQVTPDIPFAALMLAAMMLTDAETIGLVDREHFARLALRAYDRARQVPGHERGR